MAQLFANAARSTLTASITSSSTQLQINPADQAFFPVATGADWFKVALEDSSGNLEYMFVQRAVGQSLLTITERATEDAAKFPARAFVSGSLVELRMTAADLASSIAHPSVGSGAHAASAISFTPVGGLTAATVEAALSELDTDKQDKSGEFPYSQLTGAPSRYTTGELILSISSTAPTGTLAMNGQTIGSAASGAVARANADTQPLFELLWNASDNTLLPIQDATGAATTRGLTAAADFAANKRLPLPTPEDGDALLIGVSSAVLTRSVGEVLSHTHTGTAAAAGAHNHNLRIGTSEGDSDTVTNGSGHNSNQGTDWVSDHTHTLTINATGGTKNKAAGFFLKPYIAL